MAIDLLHSFLQKGQAVASQAKSDALAQTSQATSQSQQLSRAVQALQAGQTIQGEVLAVKGEDVQLALLNQLVVDARLEQSISLTPGTLMAFQVKSNSSSELSLMPLFTNTAADPNAMKALDMAGIPLTDRTLEMVKNMMQRGLPIDRQSLQEVYRDVVGYKDSPVVDIISLRQLNLPVSEENLAQLSRYENNQHFLSQTFSDIGQAIGNQLSTWISQGNFQEAAAFLSGLKEIFGQLPAGEQQLQQNPVGQEASLQGKPTDIMAANLNEQGLEREQPIVIREDGMNMVKEGAVQEDLVTKFGEQPQKASTSQTSGGLDQLIQLFSQGKATEKNVAAFQKLWGQELQPQLMMDIGQVADKEKLQEYYEKLSRQLQQLGALADKHTEPSSALGKAVQNTASNLDFMNQINQMHAYIQLPLKLSGQEAKGELYVFTNKRSLAREDGKVTALLHLDMEHLGKMDVYVALENQKVSTQFYLEKEEYLDFLEEHMDMLTSRLNKRGYECSIKTSLRKEEAGEESVMGKIIRGQNQPVLLSTQAFDMRA
ncbi:MAG: flagellar hook-length control protein FliK [Lachnospiraceae bacterium]|nr:flagellar hook-length control protein FliK [Lachnospiraceae bacterium]